MYKFAQLGGPSPILDPNNLILGDIVLIDFFDPSKLSPEPTPDEIQNMARMAIRRIFVFSSFDGTNIYGWPGNQKPTVQQVIQSAAEKYKAWLDSNGQAPQPKPITKGGYQPDYQPIQLITHAIDLIKAIEDNKLQEVIATDSSWIGPRRNSNVWQMVAHSQYSDVIDAMMNSDEAINNNVYRELIFDYTRKQKRHYTKPNTFSPNRVVRPHFIYKDVRQPYNEYILTMDMKNAPGKWRSFLIHDVMWGDRMENIRLGNPFKFTTANVLHSLKNKIDQINNKLVSEVKDVSEQEDIKNDYSLYNAMKLYYKHLKNRKGKNIDKESKIDTDSVFLPNIIKSGEN